MNESKGGEGSEGGKGDEVSRVSELKTTITPDVGVHRNMKEGGSCFL